MLEVVKYLEYLAERGYPRYAIPSYDAVRREALLAKHSAKVSENSEIQTFTDLHVDARAFESSLKVYFVLPFSAEAKSLKLVSCFCRHFSGLVPLEFTLAWTVKPNTSRILYRLNWQYN